jgi:hypothetical protein
LIDQSQQLVSKRLDLALCERIVHT